MESVRKQTVKSAVEKLESLGDTGREVRQSLINKKIDMSLNSGPPGTRIYSPLQIFVQNHCNGYLTVFSGTVGEDIGYARHYGTDKDLIRLPLPKACQDFETTWYHRTEGLSSGCTAKGKGIGKT